MFDFTPIDGIIGGFLVFLSVTSTLVFRGRAVGISGICFRTISPEHSRPFDRVFAFGFLLGAMIMYYFFPDTLNAEGAVRSVPAVFDGFPSLLYFILCGLAVGFGTKLGSGCTSGHMVCGVARLSKRSLFSTAVFASVCLFCVKVLRTVDIVVDPLGSRSTNTFPGGVFSLFSVEAIRFYLSPRHSVYFMIAVLFLLHFLACYVVVSSLHMFSVKSEFFKNYLTMMDGGAFAVGIMIAGMTKRQKVLGFFDIGGPAFDPTLAVFAISGILLTTIVWQLFLKQRLTHPTAAGLSIVEPLLETKADLPTARDIDFNLLLGSVIFGVGWGLGGFCPGPAIANLPSWRFEIIAFLLSMLFGMRMADNVTRKGIMDVNKGNPTRMGL